ncbi:MAG: hypothetical protein ACRD04_06095 [Terriglobales bacterium]
MGIIWKFMLGLVLGGVANELVGTGGFLDILGIGLADDVLLFVLKRFIPGMNELTLVESFALDVFLAEGVKIEHQEQADEDEEKRERDERNLFARHAPFVVPSVFGQFDVADLGLFWWSTDTVIASDIPAELLGIAGEAAVAM